MAKNERRNFLNGLYCVMMRMVRNVLFSREDSVGIQEPEFLIRCKAANLWNSHMQPLQRTIIAVRDFLL